MKAVQFKEYGGPEVLEMVETDRPSINENDVLIQVKAIGVNYADTARREGQYVVPTKLPFTPGAEVAGVVAEVGSNVKNVTEGERVVTLIEAGGYAEYAVAAADTLIPVPEGVSFEKAVALPLQGLTAYHVLSTMGRLEEGESVLIHAGAGGVGSLAIQLAKHFKAGTIIATASTPEKREFAEQMGADYTVDYTEEGWEKKVMELTDGLGADVALEMVGGEIFHKTLACLAAYGRLVIYGAASGEQTKFYPSSLMKRNQSVIGFFLPQIMKKRLLLQSSLTELLDYVNKGELELTVDGVYPLSEARRVHELLQGRKTKGKIVLVP